MPADRISYAERVLRLSTAAGFRDLDHDVLSVIAQSARERVFRRGEVLFDPLHPPSAVWVLVEGRVSVVRDGAEVVVVEPGFAVGSVDLLTPRATGRRATAAADVLALELPYPVMLELMEDHFVITLAILRSISAAVIAALDVLPGERTFPASGRPAEHAPPSSPLDFVERLFFLRHGSLMGSLSLRAVAELAHSVEEVRYPVGATLWREGEPADAMLFIVHGEVVVRPAHGRWVERGLPRGVIGALSSTAGTPRRGTAVAAAPVVGLRASREVFADVMEDHFELAIRILEELAEQHADLQDRAGAAAHRADPTRL